MIRAQTRQIHNFQISQAVAVVVRVADPQPFVVLKVLRRTFLDVGIEYAGGVFCAISAVRSFCALLWRTFFLSNGTKKAPRAVRGSSSASFDDMILSHFCSVCIRVFRQGRDGCAFLLGST